MGLQTITACSSLSVSDWPGDATGEAAALLADCSPDDVGAEAASPDCAGSLLASELAAALSAAIDEEGAAEDTEEGDALEEGELLCAVLATIPADTDKITTQDIARMMARFFLSRLIFSVFQK